MAKNEYYINDDVDYGYTESIIRTFIRAGETEEEAAHRILNDHYLAIWIAGKAEEYEALSEPIN